MTNTLIRFVREKGALVPKLSASGNPVLDARGKVVKVRSKGQPRGILVAEKNADGKVQIGWSYTNTNVDGFNKVEGLRRARERFGIPSDNIPHRVVREIVEFFVPQCEEHFDAAPARDS